MPDVHAVEQLIAEFLDIAPEQITPDFSFAVRRMQGSIARANLDAALRRRLGIICPAIYTATTYGELKTAIFGGSSSSTPSASATPPTLPLRALTDAPSSACGIDIEAVENLPPITDCWEQEFYCEHFSPSEIAYCLLQEDPRMHFAARWCAKEALKKCEPSWMPVSPAQIEVVSNGQSQPFFRYLGSADVQILPVNLSLSHTPQFAVAMVVRPLSAMPTSRDLMPRDTSKAPVQPAPIPVSKLQVPKTYLVLQLIAYLLLFVLVCWALARTF